MDSAATNTASHSLVQGTSIEQRETNWFCQECIPRIHARHGIARTRCSEN